MECVKIYRTNGKTETIVGAVGTNGTSAGFEFMLYDGATLFYPHQHFFKLKRVRMTDEDILSSNNAGLVAWYKEAMKRYEEKEAAAKEEAERTAETEVVQHEPVAVEGQDVEE